MTDAKTNPLKQLIEKDELTNTAFAQVKAALNGSLKHNPQALCVNAAGHLVESLNSAGLNQAQQKALLANAPLKHLIGELLMAFEKKKEIQAAQRKKEEDQKKKRAKNAAHEQKHKNRDPEEPEEEEESKRPELEVEDGINNEFEEENDLEIQEPEQELELQDVKEIVHDAEALENADIREWQDELMDDIKAMPSVGDQATWMFIVSQLDADNMAFRMAGAAHLMQSVKNAALSAEDHVLAFAGAEALRDPNTSPFDAGAPGSLNPSSEAAPGTLSMPIDIYDEKLLAIAEDHAHKKEAPFTLLPADETASPQSAKRIVPVLAKFRDNNMTESVLTPPTYEEKDAYQPPVKAKSIFGSLDLKPTESFFRDVLGGKTSQN